MEANVKAIAAILDAPPAQMVGDGFKVNNFFPKGYKIKMSPFFLLDYNAKTNLSPVDVPRGINVHPHRGFETVTIAYHGAVAHHDSAGNSGTIYPGDVQWMTAGSGILHKEFHELEYSKTGGNFQMVQLWVNLPAKDKMTKPKYQSINQHNINRLTLPNNAGSIEVIAGAHNGIKGSASTFSEVYVHNAKLNEGGKAIFSFPENYNTGFLIIEGTVKVNKEETAEADQFIYFKNEGTDIEIEALKDSIVLVLSGDPIHEPIAQYGPFLMNRPEEIQQAINDYNQGHFGYLE